VTEPRGYSAKKEDYDRRLKRIEGQVRGIARMVQEDQYCIDILTQISAVTRALQSVSVGLLDEHVRHCVRNAAADDPEQAEEMIEEAVRAVERLLKS
jgi:DNA-binding FrmR family transcriptional regulator